MLVDLLFSNLFYINTSIWSSNQLLLMSCFRISKSSALAIFPSPFLSIAFTNCLTSVWLTSFPLPRLLKASLIRISTSPSYSVPLLSVSYLSKMPSMACLSWSSDGFELIYKFSNRNYNLILKILLFIC